MRDHQGHFIGGFSSYYGVETNNLAEFLALRDGLLMCLAMTIDQVFIESDSMVVVTSIKSGNLNNWKLEFAYRECLKLMLTMADIVHGFRQKNQVADRLEAIAHTPREHKDYYRVDDLPRDAHRAFLADKYGLWSYRR